MIDMGMPGMTWAGIKKADMKAMQNMQGYNGMVGLKGLYSSNNVPGMKGMDHEKSMSKAVKHTTEKTGMKGFSPVVDQHNQKIKAHESAYPKPRDVHLEAGLNISFAANMPTQRLDKPSDGLNNNGCRVLTYADLKRRLDGPQNAPVYTRDHDAEVLLVLTGNMERYIFGFNGQTYAESQPVRFPRGQRIRVTLVNSTMMEHPIHLHGLWSELENGYGRHRPLKQTISVKPGEKLHYYVTTDDRDAGGAMGLSLPSALSHGSGDVHLGGGGLNHGRSIYMQRSITLLLSALCLAATRGTALAQPPNLVQSAKEMSAAQLFWVVKNGIKMSAMPAWGVTHSDAKLWDVVAFLEKAAQYHSGSIEGDG